MSAKSRALLLGFALVTLATACNSGKKPTPGITPGSPTAEGGLPGAGGRPVLAPEPTPGVSFRLADADPARAGADAGVRTVRGAELSAEELARRLARMPALGAGTAVTASFALRPGAKPPAITGATLPQPFPPPATAGPPPEVGSGPLTVVRGSPEGDVPMATQLTVTFSEPMVPLTSHGALAEEDVPVKLSPAVEGQWRWVGTRTLLFEPDPRFPMATEYKAEVPAGTKSARGAALAKAYSWTFRTPPAKVEQFTPSGGTVGRNPLLAAVFDQRVDPEALRTAMSASADGKPVALRLATATEVDEDEGAKAMRDAALDGRFAAWRPVQPLPIGAAVKVVFGPGLPSAEGPRKSTEAQEFTFAVYKPLAIVELLCDRRDREPVAPLAYPGDVTNPFNPEVGEGPAAVNRIEGCEPGRDWYIRFNNELAPASVDPTAFKVTPDVPGIRFEPQGERIATGGRSVGRTEYIITVPGDVEDVWGQKLGQDSPVTFVTGDARPQLYVPGNDMLVLDPAADGKLDVASVNNEVLDLRLMRVAPADWAAFRDYVNAVQQRYWEDNPSGAPPTPPGTEVWRGDVKPGGQQDTLTPVRIDLGPALTDGVGQVVAVIEPKDEADRELNRAQARWIQVTKLGLSEAMDGEGAEVWVTDLASGAPISGAAVTHENSAADGSAKVGESSTSESSGLARLAAVSNQDYANPTLTIARKGGDTAFLPTGYGYYFSGRRAALLWSAYNDRGIYRPGEEVAIKGWLRPVDFGKGGDLQAADAAVTGIDYVLTAPNGEEIATGTFKTTPGGGFDGKLTLPADVELGDAQLSLKAVGGDYPDEVRQHGIGIPIAEFRRPEYEVSVTNDAPYVYIGDTATVTAAASYFAGGPLAGAETRWNVSASPTTFSPPGYDEFVFGRYRPWWGWWPGPGGETTNKEHVGRTDAEGEHRLAISVDEVLPLAPATFNAQATVQDVNRQAWSASSTFLAHPARYYVGLRPDRWFADAGQPFKLDALVADLDGKLAAGTPIQIEAVRQERVFKDGKYVDEDIPAGNCQLTSGATDPVSCELTFDKGGQYRITATIADPEGRRNLTELNLWISGGEPVLYESTVDQQRAELIPNANEYQPGDTAEILVRSPFSPAEGLMTVRRSGLVKSERFRLDGGSHTLRLPLAESDIPNTTVQVDLVGSAPRRGADGQPDASLPRVPAFASGSLDLKIPPRVRTLTVDATPGEATLAPAGSTTVDITVTGADGKPVPNAEVALVVADEAILALTDHHIPDPIEAFYPQRSPDVSDAALRQYVYLSDPAALADGSLGMRSAMNEGLGGGGGDAGPMAYARSAMIGSDMAEMSLMAAAPTAGAVPDASKSSSQTTDAPVPERTDLNPLALFAPALVTGADGKVSAALKLPDSVTRYRITAVATDGAQRFGKGEDSITARLPLAVRPSAPRFLNFGDSFELPVVVQNQTDQPLETDVVLRAANLKLGEGGALGQRVTVPANDRVEVRFPAAAELPGEVVFQAGAFSGNLADAQRVRLPVWTPATTEAFATYGELDEGALAQPIVSPPDVVPQFGGLDMTLTSTALGNLTDAFLYLQDYPFESGEAVASRLVATVALKDVLAGFNTPGLPDAATIDAAVRRDLGKLQALQNEDGGFGWWSRGMGDCGSDPFLSTHVTHALARAKAKGNEPNADMLSRAQNFLREIDGRLDACKYSGESRRTTKAYALFTRFLLGDADRAAGRALLAESGEREIEALGWLLMLLTGDEDSEAQVTEIRRQLANRASEEASTAQFTGTYDESEGNVVLASDRRADAVALEALIMDQRDNPRIPKLARGLLDHRVKGRWGSTQENGWVLLALDRYFRTYESVTPDFVARAWLGEGFVGESEFRGRDADRRETKVPLPVLAAASPADLVLAKEGPGRLYYRLGLRYAPTSLQLDPMERGFAVTRSYEPVDDPDDVKRLADGSYEVKAGARVRVRLNMVADSRRHHVALVDPLPAGLEALNPELAVTGELPPDPAQDGPDGTPRGMADSWWWGGHWYDHQNFRDERTEAFTNLLSPGVYDYTYIARATTPGSFVVPPAKAEEMFHPETFGRGGTDRVVVR